MGANASIATSTTKRIITRPRAISLVVAVVLGLAGIAGFRGAGRWLVREDPLARADVIVVLSGSVPYRAEGAAEIYRGGYAPEIWLTRPMSPATDLATIGVAYTPEEEYSREVLIREGVPPAAVRILPGIIANTQQEVEEVAAEVGPSRKSSVIIVSSPQHTRRVRALWNRLAGKDQKAIVRCAWQDPFDRDHWWRNTRDVFAVVREFLGLFNAWTGLHVHPHER